MTTITTTETIVQELLTAMGLPVVMSRSIIPAFDSECISFDIPQHSPQLQTELIHSIQHLVRELVATRTPEAAKEAPILLDINQSLSQRVRELETVSAVLISRVTAFNTPQHADPMNALDRKILHSLLQKHTYVTTSSSGEGPDRHIVVYPTQAQL